MRNLSSLWSSVQLYITIGLGIIAIVSSIGWYTTDLKLDKERAQRELDLKIYEKAQAEYTAKALEEKQKIEERNRVHAKEADSRYADLLSKYRASLVRAQTAQRTSSGANLSVPSGTSEGSDRSDLYPIVPSGDTVGYIAISDEDAMICAVNTARLVVVQDWYKEVTK